VRRYVLFGGLLAVTTLAPASQSQEPPVYYGGGIVPTLKKGGVPVALARSGDKVTARVALTVGCRDFDVPDVIIGAKGSVSGDKFSARGAASPQKGLRVRIVLSGTFAGTSADGKVVVRMTRKAGGPRGCKPPLRTKMTLRAQAAPAGPPAMPPGGTVMRGVTDQLFGGVQLPVNVVVTPDGKRVLAVWLAMADCPGDPLPVDNYSPASTIAADGTFSRSEAYKISYSDGSTDHYRVTFKGQFLADGVVGTIRGRITGTAKGHVLGRCDTGERHFGATP
jgi:hypothetical protein